MICENQSHQFNPRFYPPSPPIQAIIPIPTSIALSSILKMGVCTPLVIPFDLLPAPSLKKQAGMR
jgi:hypothetical protein